MEVFLTIAPIFVLITLGWFAHKKGFIPSEFLHPANRLVYYFAIPAFVFRAISRASLDNQFQGSVLFITLTAAAMAYFFAWAGCLLRKVPPARAGVLIQNAGHGNLGYIGLPVAFYFLGDSGLAKASILSGFLMVVQNILSVVSLQAFAPSDDQRTGRIKGVLASLMKNPVIMASMAGILVSGFSVPIPIVMQRTLDMLGGLAPPTALLLIGASLSFRGTKDLLRSIAGAVFIKILLLPAIGLSLYLLFKLPASDYLPGLILLATPTATVAYVMAKEMKGDAELAVAAISASTLLSALTFTFWLSL